MNFFERQDNARKTTSKLIFLFVLAVLAIVIVIDMVAGVILATAQNSGQFTIPSLAWAADNAGFVVASSLGTLAFVGVSSLAKTASLSAGGGKVARSLGGTLITPDNRDPLRQRLHNVVEEMAIASGVPVPEVYVLEEESGINAFAAGFTTGDAAVAVTRGALDRLNRAELQGVIAHEFSHILNGDMRLNMRLMGILFGILVIGLIGRIVLRGTRGGVRVRSNDGKGHAAILAVGLTLFITGYLGFFFGRLIKAAVSRQREYLADASAVQFTRQTEGLAGALKKIGGIENGSEVKNTGSEEISHMFFAKGVRSLRAFFATHPPLLERIQALEPDFRPSDFGVGLPKSAADTDSWNQIESERVSGFAAAEPLTDLNAEPRSISDSVGNPSTAHVELASAIRASLPQTLYEAAQSQDGAMLLMLALVLNPRDDVRQHQMTAVKEKMGSRNRDRVAMIFDELKNLGFRFRLPLFEIAFPTLKARPQAQLQFITEFMRELVRSDQKIEPFEYALTRMLDVHLNDAKQPRRSISRKKNLELDQLKSPIATLLTVLAWSGRHGSESEAKIAYEKGRDHLIESYQEKDLALRWPEFGRPKNWIEEMDKSMDLCDRLEDTEKELLVQALVATINHDNRITLSEAEFLRAICASLHCPLPPLLER